MACGDWLRRATAAYTKVNRWSALAMKPCRLLTDGARTLRTWLTTVTLALASLATCPAYAGTVTYTLTATVDGFWNATGFTDSLMTIVASTNTAIAGCSEAVGLGGFCLASSATVTVGGRTASFASLYVFEDYGVGCSGSPDNPGVLACAGIDDGDGTGDLAVIANNALATYAFGSSIGPLDDPVPFGSGSGHVDDSGDTLSLYSWSNGSFTAVAASESAPEPGTLPLFGGALVSLALIGRRSLHRRTSLLCRHR